MRMQYRVTDVRRPRPAYRALVDRSEQIQRLPLAFGFALRLRDAGAEDEMIATALAIEPEEVAPLLELARAKLDRLARCEPCDGVRDPGRDAASPHQEVD